jgi:dimethylargininase
MTLLALTSAPSPKLAEGLRTHVLRAPIDFELALRQHEAYCDMLRGLGADVRTLAVNQDCPDGVFIEDAAVVLDEVAILASMASASRRPELAAIKTPLSAYREVYSLEPPAMLEGGDVLRVGRTLLVGQSARTNDAGMKALQEVVGRFGYSVRGVPVKDCLHLKTACTALPDRRLLVNPAWLDLKALHDFDVVAVPPSEPWAANILSIGQQVCVGASYVRTAQMIRDLGFAVTTVDLSEFAKAEGGLTCLSLLISQEL